MLTGPVIPCLALLRVEVTEPPESPRTLVRSYRTVSPSPVLGEPSHRRSALCCPDRQVTPSWLSPALCPLESRLSSTPSLRRSQCRGHPAGSPSRRLYAHARKKNGEHTFVFSARRDMVHPRLFGRSEHGSL